MTDYVRLDTTYDTINLYNIDSKNTGDHTSYRSINNIVCDTSGELFNMFGEFSKYFICKEHAPNDYKESAYYDESKMIKQPHCAKCNYLPPLNFNNIETNTANNTKIIQKKVRQDSSSRTDVMKTRTAKDKNNCNPNWSWNNQSSSAMASIIAGNNVPSRGNSVRTTLTRHRPGAASADGKGVDIKHNSYDRYLLRKKYKSLRC